MFKLEIATDNAAFEDDPAYEVARILRGVLERVEHGGLVDTDSGTLRDSNGNRVGSWEYSQEEE
jgi:hypothetical protein